MALTKLRILSQIDPWRFVAINKSRAEMPPSTRFTTLQYRLTEWEGALFAEQPFGEPEFVKLKLVEIHMEGKALGAIPVDAIVEVRLAGTGIEKVGKHLAAKPDPVFVFLSSLDGSD